MQIENTANIRPLNSDVWFSPESCSLVDFRQLVENLPGTESYPLAEGVEQRIPVYTGESVNQAMSDESTRRRLLAEWNYVFADGAGVICIKHAYRDISLIDAVSEQLLAIIEDEKSRKSNDGGDHFAAAGANDRLWNAHEKLCIAAPELFIRYNANVPTALASQAWLGPHYQITAQVNVVHPGGKPQVCHRDYHMGFQDADTLQQYPANIHKMTQLLTLQGAIAHSEMPIESGPTKLLPGSQRYIPGYMAVHQQSFRDYFEDNFVQLTLEKGDAVFFNPAVFHAAGENRTPDLHRFANLLQVGSGYGRSIETVDRVRICKTVYPVLSQFYKSDALSSYEFEVVLSACAEGYPFPTNLDADSPLGGMVPQSQLQLMHDALRGDWPLEKFSSALDQQMRNRLSH